MEVVERPGGIHVESARPGCYRWNSGRTGFHRLLANTPFGLRLPFTFVSRAPFPSGIGMRDEVLWMEG
jgi:hypothetical protein